MGKLVIIQILEVSSLKLRTPFKKSRSKLKKSKTYSEACPYLGLSIGTPLGLI
jgi:hypothetical protein